MSWVRDSLIDGYVFVRIVAHWSPALVASVLAWVPIILVIRWVF